MRWMGARPLWMTARSAAFCGSSKRCSGPSSMLKPSFQRCRTRRCGSSAAGVDGAAEGISGEGVSWPPSVTPEPREREGGAGVGSPPGRGAWLRLLEKLQDERESGRGGETHDLAFFKISLTRLLGSRLVG